MLRRPIAWLFSLLLLGPGAAAHGQSAPGPPAASGGTLARGPGPNVLVLIPVQQGRPLFDLLARGVSNHFLHAPGPPVSVSFEHLYDLLDPPGLSQRQLAFLKAKYAGQRLDGIIGLGHPDYRNVREALGLDGRIPLILLGTPSSPTPPEGVTIAMTGSVYDSYRQLQTLFPGRHRVALVGGGAAMDRMTNDRILSKLRQLHGPDRVADLTNLDLRSMRASVAAQPSGTVLLLGSVLSEPDGRLLTAPMLMAAIGPVSRGPLVVINDLLLGQGALGGALYRVEEVGARAASVCLQVLAGTPPAAVGRVELAPTLLLDARQMARFDLPFDRVPAGTTLLWREPTLWQTYRVAILGGGSIVLVQAALIAWLLAERRRRRDSQRQLAERLRVQALVAEISSAFANLPGDRLDGQIEASLAHVGTSIRAQACALFAIEGGSRPRPVCRWQADATYGHTVAEQAVLSWAWPRLERGHEVHIRDVADVPVAAPPSFDGTRAARLLLPLQVDQRVIAVLALHHAQGSGWSDQVIGDLRTIGEIIATALVRKRTDASMRQQLETLAHVNRVASLGELAASLAHELNQPLGAILSNAETAQALLQRSDPPMDLLREIVADVIADDERAGGIIRNMRGMLRRQHVDVRPVDVNAVATELTRLVAHDARLRGGTLDVDLGTDLPAVAMDPTQLQQVFLNLVVNAVDATASLHVRQTVELRTQAADSGVRIEVRDHGPGIAASVLPHLFDAFFTTKPSGLGVGLAITRSIVEAAGGRIEAANAPGGGAVFTVWLPGVRDDTPPAPARTRTEAGV